MPEQERRTTSITDDMVNAASVAFERGTHCWSKEAMRSALEAAMEYAPPVNGWIVCDGRPMTNYAHSVISPKSCGYEHHALLVGESVTYQPLSARDDQP